MNKEQFDKNMIELGELAAEVDYELSTFYIQLVTGHSMSSPELYKTATDILDKAEKLVKHLEDNDKNMNVKTSTLGDIISQVFELDPISEYVDAKVKYVENGNKENLNALLKAVAKAEESRKEQKKEEEKRLSTKKLVERIEKVEDSFYSEMHHIMDDIEAEYAYRKEFTPEDVEILRVYLRNLPYNSGADIDALSDRAVVLGFKRHMQCTTDN